MNGVWNSLFGDLPTYKKLLLAIGILWTARFAFRLLKGLNWWFGRSGASLAKRYGVGSWVVVTGATDGLGKEFAVQFAKLRFNIVLISRTQSKLDAVAEEIRAAHGVKVKTISCDFSKCHQPGFFDPIARETEELDVSVVVNNVGIDSIERFDELSVDYIERTIVINCWAMTFMQKIFLKRLTARKCSAVVNLASLIGLYPAHHYNIYSASKAFADMLSRCLVREYNNVDIISICPSEVSTPMTGNKPTDIWTITTKQCVTSALNDLARGYTRSEGHWRHKMQSLLLDMPAVFNWIWENFILNDMRKERNLPPARLH